MWTSFLPRPLHADVQDCLCIQIMPEVRIIRKRIDRLGDGGDWLKVLDFASKACAGTQK